MSHYENPNTNRNSPLSRQSENESKRMKYAMERGYGSDTDNRSGLNQFELGRRASRDYDQNYIGDRSSIDDEDVSNERERWSAQRFQSDSPRQPSIDFRTQLSRSNYDGREQGYRSPEAQYQTASARGKGPKGWKRPDERIREDVCHTLERDHVVDATEIEVSVQNGVVTLSGHTETRSAKRRSEDIIENIAGVLDIRNELTVNRSFFQQAKDFILGESLNE